MRQTWRWFGPNDTVSLSDIRQAGAQGVVTALHHLPAGSQWSDDDIMRRQHEVEEGPEGPTGLCWEVVESLPVSEEIKTQSGECRAHLEAYRLSMEALARAGLETVCYNFMPVLDWTRTDLRARMPHGGTAMRFDLATFAAFDLHILARPGASEAWDDALRDQAARIIAAMDERAQADLARAVTMGLPGAAAGWSLDELRRKLTEYAGVDADRFRQNHVDFLSEVVPLAERLGLRLCCHPDDPPFPLLGLPRIMSTAQDYRWLLERVDSPAAGMTLCTGSLGARPDNDCAGIAREFGPKIHFAHLRNVTREAETVPASFYEDEHLNGQTDMVAVVAALLEEEARRRDAGRGDTEIPMRPDHGQAILGDLGVDGQPGYPAVGRLKGLAELRGVMVALSALGSRGALA